MMYRQTSYQIWAHFHFSERCVYAIILYIRNILFCCEFLERFIQFNYVYLIIYNLPSHCIFKVTII